MFCHGLRSIVFNTIYSKPLQPQFTGNFTIDWGDNVIEYYTSGYYSASVSNNPRHTYSTIDYPQGFNGIITIRSGSLSSIDTLIGFNVFPHSIPTSNYYPLVIKGNQLRKLGGLNIFELTNEDVIYDGAISDIPKYLTRFSVFRTKLDGRIGQLPRNNLTGFTINPVNTVNSVDNVTTISGNTADLPQNLVNFTLYSDNIVTGPINILPTGLKKFHLWGQNTLSGKTSDLSSVLNDVYIKGNNTINGYVSPKQWANPMYQMQILSQVPSTRTENDNALIDLANVTSWGSPKIVYLTGPRSAFSNHAVQDILINTYGVFVTPSVPS
jgi:hypothetical protein